MSKEEESDTENLHEVRRNLKRLTMGVPPMHMEETPPQLQCHIVGVSHPFLYLLKWVSYVVVCYHETHAP